MAAESRTDSGPAREHRDRFIRDGCTVVDSGLPAEFHRAVYAKIDELFESEGNPGNNILPRVPELAEVFSAPAVREALTGLLGPDYILNPHRHCHLNPPGRPGQSWHKDCYVYDHNLRHPRFRWVLAFYYPQETTPDMGPTGVLRGTQWYRTISDPDPDKTTESELPLVGAAGSVAIVHFDAWHRATANVSDRKRYMLKFQFARTREPLPAGGNGAASSTGAAAGAGASGTVASGAVTDDVARWLDGQSGLSAFDAGDRIGPLVDRLSSTDPTERAEAAGRLALSDAAAEAAGQLVPLLHDESEAVRVNAAYALGSAGEDWVATLLASLREEALADIDLTEAKTADNGHGTNPTAPAASHALAVSGELALEGLQQALRDEEWYVRACAADALANMGAAARPALAALTAAIEDPHWWVRRNAIEALRRGGEFPPGAAECVSRALSDDDYRVRRNAAMAMRDVPAAAEESVAALRTMLRDENRYNRFYSLEALRRLSKTHEAAEQALYDELMTARWCSLTIPGSLY